MTLMTVSRSYSQENDLLTRVMVAVTIPGYCSTKGCLRLLYPGRDITVYGTGWLLLPSLFFSELSGIRFPA